MGNVKTKKKNFDGRAALEVYRVATQRPFSLPCSSLLDQATANGERAAETGDDLAELKHLSVRRSIESLIFDGPGGEM